MNLVNRAENFFKKAADLLELPKETVFEVPRIVMLGDESMLIENHKGILEFDKSSIRLKINSGLMTVSGKEFKIDNLSKEDMLIKGKINHVVFER